MTIIVSNYVEKEFYAFLESVLTNPNILKNNPVSLTVNLNKLRLLNDSDKLKEILNATYFILKINPPIYTNPETAIKDVGAVILSIAQKGQAERMNAAREMANETYVNRVKTSDKQTKAVLDFIKG